MTEPRDVLKLTEYVIKTATWTVDADAEVGLLESFQMCGECDVTAPVPGALVHKEDCIVLVAQRAALSVITCQLCDGCGSVRVHVFGDGSMGRMRRCPDCNATGVIELGSPRPQWRSMPGPSK